MHILKYFIPEISLKALIFILSITCFNACETKTPELNQKVLFEVHYRNMAWGYQENGFLIDSTGRVRSFDLVKKPAKWNSPDEKKLITYQNMEENLSHCDSIICQIEARTLKHYTGKIWAASKGNISEPRMQMADFGQIRYIAYLFDNKTKCYKEVLIKDYGDWLITNDAREAEEIYQWLINIGRN